LNLAQRGFVMSEKQHTICYRKNPSFGYQQRQGLFMGTSDAPSLANLIFFVSRVRGAYETPHISITVAVRDIWICGCRLYLTSLILKQKLWSIWISRFVRMIYSTVCPIELLHSVDLVTFLHWSRQNYRYDLNIRKHKSSLGFVLPHII